MQRDIPRPGHPAALPINGCKIVDIIGFGKSTRPTTIKFDHMIAKILLAAGAAQRMGSAKQLLIHQGRPLVRRTTEMLLELTTAGPVYIVLGARADLIRPVLSDLPVRLLDNPEWEQGMSSSIATAMRQVPATASAVLLAVVDQVKVRADLLEQIIERFATQPDHIVACRYTAGIIGVPAIFPAAYFDRLLQLQGPGGARQLLRDAGPNVLLVDFPEGEIDLDRPEDFVKI